MTHIQVAQGLSRNKDVFRHLLDGIAPAGYSWRPLPDKWCLLEILCHLHDEEREDFRARIKLVLANPEQPFPAIDPQGWVSSRRYMEQHYETVLARFLDERAESLDYLGSLGDPPWDNTYHHASLGPLSARLLLHNWLAHDLLHIRQITALKYQYLKAHSPDSLSYAGDW